MGMRIDETGEQGMAAQIDDASTGWDGKIRTYVDDAVTVDLDAASRDGLGTRPIDQAIGTDDD